MHPSKIAAVVCLVGSGASSLACSRAGVRTTGPSDVKTIEASRIRGPHVPAGTQFGVQLDRPISTETAREGQTFAGITVQPLRAPDGTIVVPEAAVVRGTIADIDRGSAPRITLAFTTIETSNGEAPLDVRLEEAPASVVPAPDRIPEIRSLNASWSGFDFYPQQPVYDTQVFLAPYGPANASVVVPFGATLQLTLTRPVLPPGTKVAPE